MSRGARALTLFGSIWDRIATVVPDATVVDLDSVWGFDKKHDWMRVDQDEIHVVTMMKVLNWHPAPAHLIANSTVRNHADKTSEAYWKAVMLGVSLDGLDAFAKHVESNPQTAIVKVQTYLKSPFKEEPSDEIGIEDSVFVPPPPTKKHTPAEWGSW